jgi:hypothetical protein
MSISGKVREFMNGCPFLEEFKEATFPVVNLNLLGEDETAYSIEDTPAEPIVKRYTNGDTLRQYVFSFCSRTLYSPSANLDTAEFYDKFSDWLDECTRKGELPELGGNLQAKALRATTGGYMYDSKGKSCQYRIQCQFTYYKRR